MLQIMLNVISPIFLVIGLAALVGRVFDVNIRPISTITIYLFSPALVFRGIATSELQIQELGQIAAMVLSVAFVMISLGWIISRLLRFDRQLESAFLLTVILVNAANYGIPLNTFAFGEAAESRAIIYYVVSVTLVTSLGIFLASRGTQSPKKALMNTFTVPLTYAGVAGLLVNLGDVTIPLPLERMVGILAEGAVPAMLVVLGVNLSRIRVRGRWGPVLVAVGFRLLIAPVVAVTLATAFGLEGITRSVAIISSSMPTAVMAGVVATQFESDAEFTTAVILAGTLVSMLTLSLLISLLGGA